MYEHYSERDDSDHFLDKKTFSSANLIDSGMSERPILLLTRKGPGIKE